jgi:hypothetical protein
VGLCGDEIAAGFDERVIVVVLRWVTAGGRHTAICGCPRPRRGENACCDDRCVNRALDIECESANCENPGGRCANRAMQSTNADRPRTHQQHTELGLQGLILKDSVVAGELITELKSPYLSRGEVKTLLCTPGTRKRSKNMMTVTLDLHVDNHEARVINHSCMPTARAVVHHLHGGATLLVLRVGVYAIRDMKRGTEVTIDKQFTGHARICGCMAIPYPHTYGVPQPGYNEGGDDAPPCGDLCDADDSRLAICSSQCGHRFHMDCLAPFSKFSATGPIWVCRSCAGTPPK